MTVATYIPFQHFVQDLGRAVQNLNGDALAIYLSNTAPNAVTAQVKADVPEIATGNGYTGPVAIGNAYAEVGGVGTLTSIALATILAAGGSIGPFRYVVLCNTSKAGSPLIAYWDYGAEVTLADTQSLRVGFGADVLTIRQAA